MITDLLRAKQQNNKDNPFLWSFIKQYNSSLKVNNKRHSNNKQKYETRIIIYTSKKLIVD